MCRKQEMSGTNQIGAGTALSGKEKEKAVFWQMANVPA